MTYDPKSVRDNYNQTVQKVFDRMKEMFGEEIASPEHEPIRFVYQIKLAQYDLNRKKYD